MQLSRDPDGKTWLVRPFDDAEEDFLEKLLTALAEKFPDPPPKRTIPPHVLLLVGGTSNPQLALEIVERLNISDDSQANLAQLYECCEHTDGLTSLQGVVDELIKAKVLLARFVVMDRRHDCGLEAFNSRSEIPEEIEDCDGEFFTVSEGDVQTVYVQNVTVFRTEDAEE